MVFRRPFCNENPILRFMKQSNQRLLLFRRQRAEIFQQQRLLRGNCPTFFQHSSVPQPFSAGIQPFRQRFDFIGRRNRTSDQPMMESLRTNGLIGMAQIEAVGKAGVGKIIQTRQSDCGFQAFTKINFVLFGMHN